MSKTTAEMNTITSTALHATADARDNEEFGYTVFAAQQESGGGVSVGGIAGIIIAVIIILAALLLVFVKTRNPNRNAPVQGYHNYPSQKQSLFALSPPKQQPQYLPTYIQPSSPYAQHQHGGLAMPQAVHPSSSGYYTHAGQEQSDDRVRFGTVGVVRY